MTLAKPEESRPTEAATEPSSVSTAPDVVLLLDGSPTLDREPGVLVEFVKREGSMPRPEPTRGSDQDPSPKR